VPALARIDGALLDRAERDGAALNVVARVPKTKTRGRSAGERRVLHLALLDRAELPAFARSATQVVARPKTKTRALQR